MQSFPRERAQADNAISAPQHPRAVSVRPVDPDQSQADADIDIIAIHGLDTKSPNTWTWRIPKDPKSPYEPSMNATLAYVQQAFKAFARFSGQLKVIKGLCPGKSGVVSLKPGFSLSSATAARITSTAFNSLTGPLKGPGLSQTIYYVSGYQADIPSTRSALALWPSPSSSLPLSGLVGKYACRFSAGADQDSSSDLFLFASYKGRRLISVINEPSVSLQAEYSTEGDCASGVAYNIALANDTSLDFFQLNTVSLATFTSPDLDYGCKLLGSGGDSTRGGDSTGGDDSSDDSNGDATQYDLVYMAVVDQSGSYVLINDDDSNLGLAQGDGSSDPKTAAADALSIPGAAYGFYKQVIASDDSDRIFHNYSDTMAAFGVSRIRLSSIDAIPNGADLLDLMPMNYDESNSTPGVYMAVDTMGNYFYTIACNIEDDAAKILIASDPDAGAAKLADPNLRYIVTGGVVQDYLFLYPVLLAGRRAVLKPKK